MDDQNLYGKEAWERWGNTYAYKQSVARTKKMSKVEWDGGREGK